MSLTAEELDSILTFTDSCEDAKQSIQELSASLFNDKFNEQRLISGLACLLECELLSKAARVGVIVALAAPKETPFREIYHRINPVLTDPHEQVINNQEIQRNKLLRNCYVIFFPEKQTFFKKAHKLCCQQSCQMLPCHRLRRRSERTRVPLCNARQYLPLFQIPSASTSLIKAVCLQ